MWVTLAVPADVGFDLGLSGMQFDLTCPDLAAGERVTIKTREVISWPVRLSGSAHGTVVVTARCRSDAGTSWDGIQVAIDLGTPEREQAENVGLHMGYGSFPDWTEEDVAGFRVSPGERVHMAFVSNESRRPIQNVVCKFASLTAVMAGRVAEQRDPVQGSPWLINPLPGSSVSVIRPKETYGFAFELNEHRAPIGIGEARFTDDAGQHWQVDANLHLRPLPDRDW